MFRLTTALGRSIFLLLFITLLAVATLKIPRSGITDGISNKFMEYAGTHLTDDVGIFHDRVALQGESAGVFEGGDKKVGGSEHWIAFDESDDEDDHPTVTAAPVLTTASAQAPSPTSSIRRDFAKFEAPHEDFSRMLSTQEREVLKGVKVRSGRDERIKRLYDLRGGNDWRDFIESLDDDSLPPLTKFTQSYIHARQNPETCVNKTFILMDNFNESNGLGTVIHGVGYILSLALRHNRILLFNPKNAPGKQFFEPGCKNRTLDCIFLPISNCTIEHTTSENTIKVWAYWDPPKTLPGKSGSIPPLLGQAMRDLIPDITPNALKYWWRVQSSSYLLRLNPEGMSRVQQLRTNSSMHTGTTFSSTDPASARNIPLPFPLPRGCFSMHVRHGDKGIEMALSPLTRYLSLAESFAATNPLHATKCAFISTEDASVLAQARNLPTLQSEPVNTTSTLRWTYFWSLIPRINGGPAEQLAAFGNRTEMALKWMVQMMMAGECAVPVGTRGSGWNRMVDEVRLGWGLGGGWSGGLGYIEVGEGEDWVHYNF